MAEETAVTFRRSAWLRSQRWFALLVVVAVGCGAVIAPGLSVPAAAQPSGRSNTELSSSAVVSTSLDSVDGSVASLADLNASPGADGRISLREALLAANATPLTDTLTILFNIAPSDPGYTGGRWVIQPRPANGALPGLSRGNIVLDAGSQPGGSIVLEGGDDPGVPDGITITSSGNILRGLTIQRFYYSGVVLSGNAADNRIEQSVLQDNGESGALLRGAGVTRNQISGSAIQDNLATGVEIADGAHSNRVGGETSAERNMIRRNRYFGGVYIHDAGTDDNALLGNWFGLSDDGVTPAGNAYTGIRISGGARRTQVGKPGAGNVIVANGSGVSVEGGVESQIMGNLIGLGPDGFTALPNQNGGIFLRAGAHHNVVGGAETGAGNVISANGQQGIYIAEMGSDNNIVQGNYIGVDRTGLVRARGNQRFGVLISLGAEHNTIGGAGPGQGNVIAANGSGGVRVDTDYNQIVGNYVGTGADGVTPLGNQSNGLRVGGEFNTIGPANVIAYSSLSGVVISGSSATVISNTVQANMRSGICVAGAGSLISGNTVRVNGGLLGAEADCAIQGGIVITGTGQTLVVENSIYENRGAGVTIRGGTGNRVLTNSISGNAIAGILLQDGGNQQIAAPVITEVVASAIAGRSCPECLVEVFSDFGSEGRYYIGETRADDQGGFALGITREQFSAPQITATLTDSHGNTSSFAEPVLVPPSISPIFNQVYLPLAQ